MKISPHSQIAYKMSATKRLAKRSIVGTRVCAPGPDKLYYAGIIQRVKTPAPLGFGESANCIQLTADTKYTVRFDLGQAMIGCREYLGSELIGDGFQSVASVNLAVGQRVYITYNGRESSAEVVSQDFAKEEVNVRIPATSFEVSTMHDVFLESVDLSKNFGTFKLDFGRLIQARFSEFMSDLQNSSQIFRIQVR